LATRDRGGHQIRIGIPRFSLFHFRFDFRQIRHYRSHVLVIGIEFGRRLAGALDGGAFIIDGRVAQGRPDVVFAQVAHLCHLQRLDFAFNLLGQQVLGHLQIVLRLQIYPHLG